MISLLNGINRHGEAAPIVRMLLGQETEGGARACAWEPARELNSSRAIASQTTGWGCRVGIVKATRGVSAGVAEWATQHSEQLPSCARCPV